MLPEYSGPPALVKQAIRDMKTLSVQLDGKPPVPELDRIRDRVLGWLTMMSVCATCPVEAKFWQREVERWEQRAEEIRLGRSFSYFAGLGGFASGAEWLEALLKGAKR